MKNTTKALFLALISVITMPSGAMDSKQSSVKTLDPAVESAILQAFTENKAHFNRLLEAYEKCDSAKDGLNNFFEPCSEVLRLEGDIAAYQKSEIFRNLVKEHGEDAVLAIIANNNPEWQDLEKKSDRLGSLRTRFSYRMHPERLIETREKMRQDTDTRDINNAFPTIVRDTCNEKKLHWGRPSCKDLQGYFYGLHKYLEKDDSYHPFRHAWSDVIEQPGAVLVQYPPFVELDTGHIAAELKLSAKTTHILKDLMLQAYHGNGYCEPGPSLDRNAEDKQIREEHAQFPEPLKKSCNLFGWDECGRLRNTVYDIQNPSQHIPTKYDKVLTPERLARMSLWDLYHNDQARIEAINENFNDEFCKNNRVFGCHSHEEAEAIMEQFNELLKPKE